MEAMPEINLDTAKKSAKQTVSTLKSAGSLVAKKAEETKIATVTLPRAYGELGKVIYKNGSWRQEFEHLFQVIDDLFADRQRINDQAESRPTAVTLAEKAKQVASDATAIAKKKGIDLQAFQAFARLGEAVYEKHQAESGPTLLVQPIDQAIARRDQLGRELMQLVPVAAKTIKGRQGMMGWLKIGGVGFLCIAVIGSCISNNGGGGGGSRKGGGSGVSTIRPVAKDLPKDPEMRDAYEDGWERGVGSANEWLDAMKGHAEGQPLRKYAREHAWVGEKKDGIVARYSQAIATNEETLKASIRKGEDPVFIRRIMLSIRNDIGYRDGFKQIAEAGLSGKDTSNSTSQRTDTTTLTVAEARRLIQRDSWLVIKNPTKITNEVAKVLAEFPLGLDLVGVTTLSDTAIDILAQKPAGHLRLGGLKSLSDKAAKSLSQNRSPVMVLDGVPTISDKAAASLAQHPGSLLSLGGLAKLSPQAAKSLASYKGDLYLDGLPSLTPELATILAKHQGGLSLKGVAKISPELAEKLALHRGALYLDGLKTLPRDAAKPFAGHSGALSLNALTILTPEVAEPLVQAEGELSLNGLATPSLEVATVLARHKSRLYLKGMKLKELPEAVKNALRKHPRIALPDNQLSL
jgi:hypothetical protein